MKDGLSKAVTPKTAMLNAFDSRFRSGRSRVQLLQFFLEAPDLTPTPVDSSLEVGYICSQLKAIPEAGLGLPKTVRNQDSKPVQGILRDHGGP